MRKRRFTCSLYRFYSATNELLYIGVTRDLERRLAQHLNEKHWYFDIERIKVEHFRTRWAAEDAEKKAIAVEFPKYNLKDNEPGWTEYIEIMKSKGFAVHG